MQNLNRSAPDSVRVLSKEWSRLSSYGQREGVGKIFEIALINDLSRSPRYATKLYV
ncbi:MAG: hypothetical protein ACJAY7_000759 [Pseudohongiellaceae bacterium]|jgi:hypothetical protein